MGARLANARAETVAEKPSFRRAFLERPCVLPVDGYYEWRVGPQGAKLPHFFTRRDEEPLLLAGLFERWHSTRSDEVLLTCCVITTEPSADVVEVHDRMPVVLDPSDLDAWLQGDATLRHTLLRPAPEGTLHHHEVSQLVNSTRHDGPHLIDPEGTASLF
jgi:putative SOS response-associated peptidase YedK